jgi:hypothetical protein
VDNIDHNPSSATDKDYFHGTGISLMQHASHTHGETGRGVPVISQGVSATKSVTPLPSAHTIVPPAGLKTQDFIAPGVHGPVSLPTSWLPQKMSSLYMAQKVIEKSTMDGWKSLSAYHTDVQQAAIPSAAINALLPLFLDNARQ